MEGNSIFGATGPATAASGTGFASDVGSQNIVSSTFRANPDHHNDTKIAVCPSFKQSFVPCYETSGIVDGIVLPLVVVAVAGLTVTQVARRQLRNLRPPPFVFARDV